MSLVGLLTSVAVAMMFMMLLVNVLVDWRVINRLLLDINTMNYIIIDQKRVGRWELALEPMWRIV